jgi:PAS domain S-box-containing protein
MLLELEQLKTLTEELVVKDEQLHKHIYEWQSVLDAINDIVFIVNPILEITFANKAFYKRLGLPKYDVLAKTCNSILCRSYNNCMLSDGGVFFIESLDGWFEYARSPIVGKDNELIGYISILKDVTDKKKIEFEIEQSRQKLEKEVEKFRFMYEESPLVYQSLDSKGIILQVNKKWSSVFGYEKGEVIGKSIELFIDKEWPDNDYYLSLIYLDENVNFSDFKPKFIHKDGHEILMIIDGRLIHDFDGIGKQTHCILHEFTERNNCK